MDPEEARRIVAEAVLARSGADRDDPDDRANLERHRLELVEAARRDGATEDDLAALLIEAVDLAAYLGAWTRDFGASVHLVLGALPIGAGLPAPPSVEDTVLEWRDVQQ
jgi:hypothetical protein